jgi:hypothetical protein
LLLAQGVAAQDSSFNDGIPDAWREKYFGANSGDTQRAGALADPDRDGANNYLEYITGTDPTDARSFDRSPAWVATYVGSELGWRDGFRWHALLNSPRDMAWDPQGRLWFTETGDDNNSELPSNRIRIVSRVGFVTTLTGDAEPGLVEGPLLVTIETPATDAQVRYTTNGRRPTSRSALYSGPFTVSTIAVVKARLFVNDTPVSDVVSTKLTGEREP